MTGSIRLKTLGQFVVSSQQDSAALLKHYHSDHLLLYLALEHGRAHTREQLIALMWPNAREESGRANLRQALHRIRRMLELEQLSHVLISDTHTVRILPNRGLEVDALELMQLHETSQRHAHRRRNACHVCIQRLTELTLRYEGPFLESLTGLPEPLDAWRQHWQTQLHQQVLQAHTELLQHHELQASHEPTRLSHALQHAQAILSLEPFHEEGHRQYMRLLTCSGQRSAACRHYEALCARLESELDTEPEDETEELYQQIKNGEVLEGAGSHMEPPTASRHLSSAPRGAGTRHLPAPLNTFFGREVELSLLLEFLEQPTVRLLTLVGPGGVGKTRLALEALRRHPPALQHGYYFVPLTSVTSQQALFEQLALVLVAETAYHTSAEAAVRAYLKSRELLLVLDGFEAMPHLVSVLTHLLETSPRLTLLVTSRVQLCLSAEHVLRIQPWPEPAAEHVAFSTAAPLLLLQARARQFQPEYTLCSHALPDLLTLCRLTGGLPLGLELAAAQLVLMPLSQLLEQLKHSLDMLVSPLHDLAPHHRSLTALFDWSWRLLSTEAQRVLLSLSIFEDDFGVDAALNIAETSMGQLQQLLHASLLEMRSARAEGEHHRGIASRETGGSAHAVNSPELHIDARLRLSSPLRQYLQQRRSAQSAEEPVLVQRFVSYYAETMTAWLYQLQPEPTVMELAPLSLDWQNYQMAWKMGLHSPDPLRVRSIGLGLCTVYRLRSWPREGRLFFESALEQYETIWQLTPTQEWREARAELNAKLGWLAHLEGRLELARPYLQQAVDLACGSENALLLGSHLFAQAQLYASMGESMMALQLLRQASPHIESVAKPLPLLLAEQLLLQGRLTYESMAQNPGAAADALAVFERCRRHSASAGLFHSEVSATVGAGQVLLAQSRIPEAKTLAEQALQTAKARGDLAGQLDAMVLTLSISRRQRKRLLARRLAEESLRLASPSAPRTVMVRLSLELFHLHTQEDQLASARFHLREALEWGRSPLPRLLSLHILAVSALWRLEQDELSEGRVLYAGFLHDPLKGHPALEEVRERLKPHVRLRAERADGPPTTTATPSEMVLGWLKREL